MYVVVAKVMPRGQDDNAQSFLVLPLAMQMPCYGPRASFQFHQLKAGKTHKSQCLGRTLSVL